MLSPSSKGWINKYFDLVEKGEIVLKIDRPKGMEKLPFMHMTLSHSGIIYGFPLEFIFAKNLDFSTWTKNEKLKFLLFESHLFVYSQINKDVAFNKETFIASLCYFYAGHSTLSISKIFTFFLKETEEEKIESILSKRIDIKLNLLENKWWINSLSNAFCFLDVILFDDFNHKSKDEAFSNYELFAFNAMTAVILAAHSDGVIEEQERSIFDVFLASTSLHENERNQLKEKFKTSSSINDLSLFTKRHWLFKRFLLDLSILTITSNKVMVDEEMDHLVALCEQLDIPLSELDENLGFSERFLLMSHDKIEFMKNTTSYEKVYSSLSKRWTKIILRNKDKIALELKESKELISLVKKSTSHELTKEEKEQVKTQFKDILKSVPAVAIFMIPGGAFLLPIVLKILPDLIPSAFKENEIDDE